MSANPILDRNTNPLAGVSRAPAKRPYDVPTAVTFLMAGVAVGAILTLLFPPLRGRAR